jgi:uncharacterized membrane protein YraQ (UPF0718 family)
MPKRTVIEFGFLLFVIAPFLHFGKTSAIATFSVTFVAILLEAMPFLLIGALVSGLLEEFVSHQRLTTVLAEGRKRTLFLAALLGILFPVCECAIVPVIRKLLHKGIPLSAAVAFLLAGPIVNPIVFASTWVAYGLDWEVALIRVVCGYGIALFVGFAVGRPFGSTQAFLSPSERIRLDASLVEPGHGAHRPPVLRILAAVAHGADDFLDMAPFLIMGALMAALAKSVIGSPPFLCAGREPFLGDCPDDGAGYHPQHMLGGRRLCHSLFPDIASSPRADGPHGHRACAGFEPGADVPLGIFRPKAILTLSGMTVGSVLVLMLLFHAQQLPEGESAGIPVLQGPPCPDSGSTWQKSLRRPGGPCT